ncbi:alpha/beta fold hydrolase [Bacillus atrophaeus]|uniref:alpha/beta fold hydrolase n=1 Tax=Bacillus atrophaeus TaxID=1452 RepID=UPI00227FBA4E|nr:alpha/beta hydrolase [Bacillus atrophaeus]MCY8837407.1 alpha/beta hydrolase [Bacillus atrophaeus]MEC5220209.1 alpha/beta hydrolase [Bacillus atrophaeus]MED4580437.1 alpha/beta hydrolase [Bacillus atrophaeus]MED4720843.1 alpha/beta hydrolase [Bacillus atrophaeus]MED4849934.1 alpha/beta hydrolase [Bacillus atrophaeus]
MDLYYEVNGNGHPVVLLHSGGADLRDWKLLTPLLAKHYKVVTFDGRGTGKSPSPLEHTNYVEDLLSLLDHLELDKAALIGHSFGGQIATEFALNYPERVSKLVLVAPALSGFSYSQEFTAYLNKINEAAPDIEKMLELSLSASLYHVVMAGPHRNLMVQMQRHYFKRILKWPAFEMIWPQPPAIDRLEELNADTLFIIGKEDFQDNHRVADCFRIVPKARFVEIADADHMVTLTHPENLYHHITCFMEN